MWDMKKERHPLVAQVENLHDRYSCVLSATNRLQKSDTVRDIIERNTNLAQTVGIIPIAIINGFGVVPTSIESTSRMSMVWKMTISTRY